MKVLSILKAKGTDVATVTPEQTIGAVVRMLREAGIGALVVSADGRSLQGLIAERHVVLGLAEHGARVLGMRVDELMTRSVVSCAPEDSLTSVMAQMTRHRVRQVPVVEDGVLRGIVSIGDVVKHRLEELETETNVLREAFLARQ